MKQITSVFSFGTYVGKLEDAVNNLIYEAGVRAKEDMQHTTVHFDTVAPNFTIDVKPGMVEVGPEDNYGGLIWFFLDLGTKIRYATMTKDPPYAITTTINSLITSSAHSGGVAFVNTRRPRPGIKARNWTTIISLKQGRWFQDKIKSSMSRIQAIENAANRRDIRRDVGSFRRFNLPPKK